MNQRDQASINTLSETSEWTVFECVHGCLHVQLGRVMLKFTREEFHKLVTLVGDAYVRLGVRDAVNEARPH